MIRTLRAITVPLLELPGLMRAGHHALEEEIRRTQVENREGLKILAGEIRDLVAVGRTEGRELHAVVMGLVRQVAEDVSRALRRASNG